jgi:hypothetical protein
VSATTPASHVPAASEDFRATINDPPRPYKYSAKPPSLLFFDFP